LANIHFCDYQLFLHRFTQQKSFHFYSIQVKSSQGFFNKGFLHFQVISNNRKKPTLAKWTSE